MEILKRAEPRGDCRVLDLKHCAKRVILLLALSLLAVATYTSHTSAWEVDARDLAALPISLATQDPLGQDPSTIVSAFYAALNAHDVDEALALFAVDAVVNDPSNIACLPGPPPLCGPSQGRVSYTTKNQIRGWLEQLARNNIAIKEVGTYQVSGDNVTWTLEVSVNEYRRLDVAPLIATGSAFLEESKIQVLTIRLNADSTKRLALAYASSQQTPFSIMTAGVVIGLVALAFVFPGAAVYYVSRVRLLFASVPWMKKPWILLEVGVATLSIAALSVAIRDAIGIQPATWSMVQSVILIVSALLFLTATVLMKIAWTLPETH